MRADEAGAERRRAQAGGIDLPTIQKYLNLWYTLSLDLFGGEISSNAADAFASGLKGRHKEDRYSDHRILDSVHTMDVLENDRVVTKDVAMRTALNEVLRGEYIKDCQRGVDRWNKTIKEEGIDFELRLPSSRFHRQIGMWSEARFTPAGEMITQAEWDRQSSAWLPSADDEVYVKSLMQCVTAPGKIANWIAPPAKGINALPQEFQYVKL